MISFPRRLRRTQCTVRQMNADSNKLPTTAIQMPCFEITMDVSCLLLWRVLSWAPSVFGASLLSSETVDAVVFENTVEVCVLLSRMRNSAIIAWGCFPVAPFPEFWLALLTLLWVRSRGRRMPRWLLGMIGNPRWSSGTAVLFNIFFFWSSVSPVKFMEDRPVGLAGQWKTGRRIKVVATVGITVVVTFCTLVALGEVLLWDTSRWIRCAWLKLQEAKIIRKNVNYEAQNTFKRCLIDKQ